MLGARSPGFFVFQCHYVSVKQDGPETDKNASCLKCASGSSANLTLGNQASLSGGLTNVEALALNDGGRWNMVEDSEVGQLSMAGDLYDLVKPRNTSG